MISSVKFTKSFGYISQRIDKPEVPKKPDFWFNDTEENRKKELEKYQKKLEEYQKEYSYWKEHRYDFKRPWLAKNLLDKTFHFYNNKINVIFGPNACGKTTILRAIAGNAFIKDGYSHILEPFDYEGIRILREDDELTYEESLEKTKLKWMKNSAKVKWDGTPIYYENFASKTGSTIGDLCGSIISDIGEEVMYYLNKDRISQGQNSMFIFNKVLQIAKNPMTVDKMFEHAINKYCKDTDDNDNWKQAVMTEYNYMKSLPNANTGQANTIMFDEIDKSMDITNVVKLYTEVFPDLLDKYHMQFILVSHSPIILSDKIYNSDKYNIISVDEEYTQKCRDMLKTLY